MVLYEIRIDGEVGSSIRTVLGAHSARVADGDTWLTVALIDQPAMFGLLAQIEALGLRLISMQPSDRAPDAAEASLNPPAAPTRGR